MSTLTDWLVAVLPSDLYLHLEGAEAGIRVNVVNPDAVIRGSKIWSGKWSQERAAANQIAEADLEAFYRDRSSDRRLTTTTTSMIGQVVLGQRGPAPVAQQLKALRGGSTTLDGFKGRSLSFRAWDGQLRQPLFLSHVDGVVGTAPLDGVLHPKEVLDTLGVDEQESACKSRP